MSIYHEQLPGVVGKYDIPHLLSLDDNLLNVYVASLKLTPTAVLPANWVLWENNGPIPYIFDVEVSSDTNIEILWGQTGIGDPNFTAVATSQFGRGGGPAATLKWEAQVAAAVAFGRQWGGAFISANVPYKVLGKGWFVPSLNTGFMLRTAAVAANVYCQVQWVEFVN